MLATEQHYSSQQVSRLTGLSARQISYWRRTGLVTPSHHTHGGHARYDFRELVALRTAKQLLEARVSVQKLRGCLQRLQQFLPKVDQPLSELSLLATGDVILVLHDKQVFDTVSGQEWIFSLAELISDIEAQKSQLPNQGELFPSPVSHQQGGTY